MVWLLLYAATQATKLLLVYQYWPTDIPIIPFFYWNNGSTRRLINIRFNEWTFRDRTTWLKITKQGNKDEKRYFPAAPNYCATASAPLVLRQSAAPKSIGAFLCAKALRQKINYLTLCAEDLPKIGTQIHPGQNI